MELTVYLSGEIHTNWRDEIIQLCEKEKLNYVSCSPYRVPVARLAAAQAYLKKKQ